MRGKTEEEIQEEEEEERVGEMISGQARWSTNIWLKAAVKKSSF